MIYEGFWRDSSKITVKVAILLIILNFCVIKFSNKNPTAQEFTCFKRIESNVLHVSWIFISKSKWII